MATLLENVIRKILQEDFVRLLGGALVDGDGNPIDLGIGSGSGMVPFYAYASDQNGTGFTLANSTELEYVAVKVAAPDAVLTVADFAGLWFHRKGLPGTSIPGADGLDGKNGGFSVVYSSDTAATDPGQGIVKFNNANPALATAMYISALSPSGTDLTGLISTIPSGAKFVLEIDSPVSGALAVFQFTSVPTDNTDWFTVSITNLSMSSSSFTQDDTCVFQIMGFSNIAIDPVTGRLMVDGVDKSGTTEVATFSVLPDPTTVPLNVYYVAAQDCFVYANGSEWWPVNRRAIVYRSGNPTTVIAPASLASAIADNGSGKVRVTAAAHGLTSGQNNGKIYISGGGTWTAGLYRFTYVSASTYDLQDVTYGAGLGVPTVARGNATDEIVVQTIHIPPLTTQSSIELLIASLYNDSTETKRTIIDWEGVRFYNRNDNTSGNDASFHGPTIINLNSNTLRKSTLGLAFVGGKSTSGSVPIEGTFNTAVGTTMILKALLGNSTTPIGTESITFNDIRAVWES
ncbi:MAG: hypothetical protein K2Q13_04080 [Nitrosomonas sp.]|uniref:hypothetical protein n=1 Tax=Nitrosomonas sp. TaxID=42353 RepID=UPI0025CFA3C9|nr:hypothetical protein [Nitrosomonas sp.]MBY0474226.1 hypothetical protein [Nitrosomonas sp.]